MVTANLISFIVIATAAVSLLFLFSFTVVIATSNFKYCRYYCYCSCGLLVRDGWEVGLDSRRGGGRVESLG